MKLCCWICTALGALLMSLCLAQGQQPTAEPIVPKEVIKLFNGKDYTGLTTFLQDNRKVNEDPRKVFLVTDGMLHFTGDGFGYARTNADYKDYHLIVEYKWGPRTWGSRKNATKDSGILLHCIGPDGNSGAWMASIECQIIQGGTGDFILVNANKKLYDGPPLKVQMTCEVELRKDGKRTATVWKKGGEKKAFTGGRIDWFGRDPDWKDVLGFRGKNDVESPDVEGEKGWTRVECICDGGKITNIVNGTVVNEGFDATPAAGKILLQVEGAEIFFRKFELHPLKK
jgi:hypothetical protein